MDEKWRIQALYQSQPVLPLMPGTGHPGLRPRRHNHRVRRTRGRHRQGARLPAGRHPAEEFKKFLIKLDKEVPDGLDIHLICDNYASHKVPAIKKWLLGHPRFHLHFTPTGSSWLNLVERWFAELTNKQIRRGVHKSVHALERDIRNSIAT
ncbi:transposase [Streptomyces chryseus]